MSKWIEDTHVDSCMGCYKKFTLLNRKHHCRSCGRVFCNSCSNFRALVRLKAGGPEESSRVCSHCKKFLDKQKEWTGSSRDMMAKNNDVFTLYRSGLIFGVTATKVHLKLVQRSKEDILQIGNPITLELVDEIPVKTITSILEGANTSVLKKSKASALSSFTIMAGKKSIDLEGPDVRTKGEWVRALKDYLDFKRMKHPTVINKNEDQKLDIEKKAHKKYSKRDGMVKKRDRLRKKYELKE